MTGIRREYDMKVAILYIAIGRYTIFWDEFYKSSEKYFLKNAQKHYFIFTDGQIPKGDDRTILYQENLGWPLNTLLRYRMFMRIKNELKDYDYVYFFNANMEFISPVTEENIIPKAENDYLIAALHPINKRVKNPDDFEYDRNPACNAYVPKGQGKHYYQAAISGGAEKEYMDMVEELSRATDKDLENNIIAQWHDESHFNCYMAKRNPLVLDYNYMQSETGKPWIRLKPGVKIIQRDKGKYKYGGHAYLRGQSDEIISLPKFILQKILPGDKK